MADPCDNTLAGTGAPMSLKAEIAQVRQMQNVDDNLLKIYDVSTDELRILRNDHPRVLDMLLHCLTELRVRREMLGKLLALILFLLCLFPSMIEAQVTCSATFAWDSVSSASGYKLYYGTASRDYSNFVDVENVTEYQWTELPSGVVLYIAATAYDGYNNESVYSSELIISFNEACSINCINCGFTLKNKMHLDIRSKCRIKDNLNRARSQ